MRDNPLGRRLTWPPGVACRFLLAKRETITTSWQLSGQLEATSCRQELLMIRKPRRSQLLGVVFTRLWRRSELSKRGAAPSPTLPPIPGAGLLLAREAATCWSVKISQQDSKINTRLGCGGESGGKGGAGGVVPKWWWCLLGFFRVDVWKSGWTRTASLNV